MKKFIKPQVVILDHEDSFTYNLVAALGILGASVTVFRTTVDIEEIKKLSPTHIVFSPGPGHPNEVPLFQKVLDEYKYTPILGVCLGHQAIAVHFGAEVVCASMIMHGKTSEIEHEGGSILQGLPNRFIACRYHSLIVRRVTINPRLLEVTSVATNDGAVMGLQSIDYPHIVGVQFHPEAFLTEHGPALLGNFLNLEVKGKSESSTRGKSL
ncbi:MAG: aminodeoxychorismate/anthranilate synthase component II [Candidatus Taylorbacteria bacterium]